jgi:hypothetical protein
MHSTSLGPPSFPDKRCLPSWITDVAIFRLNLHVGFTDPVKMIASLPAILSPTDQIQRIA